MSRTTFLALFILCFPVISSCESTSCEQSIPVDVRDRFGHFVSGLQSASFDFHSYGPPGSVRSASVPTGPRRVVLLLDTSGSISRPDGPWSQARYIAEHVAASPAEIRLALVIFAGRILETYDFSQPREEIIHRLQELKNADALVPNNAHQTALWDSMLSAITLFGTPQIGDAIYAITDAGDNHSHATSAQVRRSLLAQRVRMFALGLERRDFPSEEEKSGIEELSRLAEASGGSYESVDQRAKDATTRIKTTASEFYDKIAYFYRMEVAGPTSNKVAPLKLTIADTNRTKRGDLTVAYPREMMPCQAANTR